MKIAIAVAVLVAILPQPASANPVPPGCEEGAAPLVQAIDRGDTRAEVYRDLKGTAHGQFQKKSQNRLVGRYYTCGRTVVEVNYTHRQNSWRVTHVASWVMY